MYLFIYLKLLYIHSDGCVSTRYAERCGMGPVDEESSPLSRLYEAPCPPVGAPLTQAIPLTPLASLNAFDPAAVEAFLR